MLKTRINGVRIHSITSTLPQNSTNEKGNSIYRASFHQTTADLGFDAASRLIEECEIDIGEIGFLLFGSKTPDYRSPITAAVLQGRLCLSIDCICYDINVGINAFGQLTQIGSSVLKNINKKYGLLILGDTPSKFTKNTFDCDYEVSDAATAVLLEKTDSCFEFKFINYNLGLHLEALILKSGGFRNFNRKIPFDSTEILNFIVQENEELIKIAFDSVDLQAVDDFVIDSKVFYHSHFLKYARSNVIKAETERILADASELPILLASIREKRFFNNLDLSFISFGEGLSLYGMRINDFPNVIKTEQSTEIFSDFRVSHEM